MMRDIGVVQDAYLAVDAEIARLEKAASSESDRLQFQLLRYVNDSTYYVSVFAQFEIAVRDKIDTIVSNQRRLGTWPARAPWDVLNHDRLQFMDLVALIFQKGHSEYTEIKGYYDERNTVAHGNWLKQPAFIPGFISRLIQLENLFPA